MKITPLLLAVLLTAALAGPAMAQPQPVQQGDVTYVTGGVGVDERTALESTEKDYNLRISNADKAGKLTTADSIVVTSRKGGDVIRIETTDPLFYAKLPPGTYTIDAVNGTQHKTQKITLTAGKPTDIHFIW